MSPSELGLTPEPISTQVIPRDRHAMFFATLGVIASSIERLAVEIRHLQRTEVLEAEEYFAPGQKGSVAMPHKRNPVLTENLTGLARMVRAAVVPAMENVALWHERDISHSSVERFIGPDACITLDFALARLTSVIDKLLVYPERMQKNLDRMGGLIHSQRVLLALTQAGLSREDSYALVQRNAMKVWESDGAAVAARPAQGRSRGHRASSPTTSSRHCSTSIIISSRSTRSSSGFSAADDAGAIQPLRLPARWSGPTGGSMTRQRQCRATARRRWRAAGAGRPAAVADLIGSDADPRPAQPHVAGCAATTAGRSDLRASRWRRRATVRRARSLRDGDRYLIEAEPAVEPRLRRRHRDGRGR